MHVYDGKLGKRDKHKEQINHNISTQIYIYTYVKYVFASFSVFYALLPKL